MTTQLGCATARPQNQWRFAAIAMLIMLFAADAFAQVTVTTGGSGGVVGEAGWTAMKGVWFGPIGLMVGAVIFALAVYFFFKEGVLAVLGVIGVGVFVFFVPAIVVGLQTWAKTF